MLSKERLPGLKSARSRTIQNANADFSNVGRITDDAREKEITNNSDAVSSKLVVTQTSLLCSSAPDKDSTVMAFPHFSLWRHIFAVFDQVL